MGNSPRPLGQPYRLGGAVRSASGGAVNRGVRCWAPALTRLSLMAARQMPGRSLGRPPATHEPIKPRLRGWIHAVTAPLGLIVGVALVWLAPTARVRWGMLVFALTACLLFATSAIYHRGNWSPRVALLLRRLDHANIFLVIAGTYTAFALTLLPTAQATGLLLIMWICAMAGVAFKVFWLSAPRWVSTPLYVLLGWVAVFYLEPLYRGGGPLVIALIALGGVFYTIGAVIFGVRRPNPSPRWFGFHEFFHVLTVLAFAAHALAAAIALRTGIIPQ